MKILGQILSGLTFIAVGTLFISLSIFNIKNNIQKNKTYTEITSVVVDYGYDEDEGLRAIIVEYTVDGKVYRKQANSYSSFPKSKGTEVKIKYNPNDPSEIIWVHDSTNIIFLLSGLIFSLFGVFLIVIIVKTMKENNNSPTIEQSIELNNNVDDFNTLQNNQNSGQPTPQLQQKVQTPVNQNGQVSKDQQPIDNQIQDTFPQNSNNPKNEYK